MGKIIPANILATLFIYLLRFQTRASQRWLGGISNPNFGLFDPRTNIGRGGGQNVWVPFSTGT